jgi:hypothetical protein
MAIRARLAAPAPVEREAHASLSPQWSELPMRLLSAGDRRMEAETYLSGGYGLRLALQERPNGWVPLSQLARVWQPLRLKGTLVPEGVGTPFLAATQVFDVRPIPRKWLAIEKTNNASDRFLKPGTIVVTCSGAVGRATLAYDAHADTLISHDLLRVEPRTSSQQGWIYAYLRSQQARAMMNSAQYGHIIKHLETSHLDALPTPVVRNDIAADFQRQVERILELRNEAHNLSRQAEALFSKHIGPIKIEDAETGYSISASQLTSKRRRFEANYHSIVSSAILKRFAVIGAKTVPLSTIAERVWWMTRFRRFYGDAGIPYLSADELFTTNGVESKKILVEPGDGHEDFYVKEGWLVMACSGQVYGLNGACTLITPHHENTFFSHDLIRIVAKRSEVLPGYLLTALSHPILGRPLLMRAAYGTSIPHLDPGDVAAFPVVRLGQANESQISALAQSAADARAAADVLERKIAADAGILVDKFLAGDSQSFVMTTQRRSVDATNAVPGGLHEHARVRLLRRVGDQPKGTIGAVVHVYANARGLEIEFVKAKGSPSVLTVDTKDVDLLND